MYATLIARRSPARIVAVVTVGFCALALGPVGVNSATAAGFQTPSLVYKLSDATERLELTTNTSRILTLDKNIPRVQVNNPDLLAVTPLSANQVQVSAKKAGVTQVNLWDEDGQIHTVDILIYGDVRELEVALMTQFPNSSIRVYRYSESLVLKGFVDQPEHVSQIAQLASDYAPKVINNITVGGVQQVLLKVRVMEISRTKMRKLGVDWAAISGSGGRAMSSISEIITFDDALLFNNDDTFNFVITDGGNTFFGFLDALERRNIAKTLAEPNIVAVSGRPAQFNVGGEFPILIPQSLGTTTIEYKKFGTQIDFLPIVLGNGNIRLEVRPRISNIDKSLSPDITTSATDPPALTIREVDTAVEMKTGQTFALAGLVQERTESEYRGLPWISDLPIIGVPFRKVEENVNEIELLILVTPEFVDGMEPHEVACAGPGYGTTSPDDCDLYCSGHLEVPAPCNPISGMTACGECSQGGCASGGVNAQADSIISDGMPIEGGTGYDDSYTPTPMQPGPGGAEMVEPESMPLPPETPEAAPLPPQALNPFRSAPDDRQAARPDGVTDYTVPRPYSPSRQPVFVRNATSPDNPQGVTGTSDSPVGEGGLFGPIGYDAQ